VAFEVGIEEIENFPAKYSQKFMMIVFEDPSGV
jgi:hypothetical protein